MKVTATAEVIAVSENGKMITFKVSAFDEEGPIGEGTHTRAIISNDRFLQKCNEKLERMK
jgi:predicted thioesterase